LACRARGAGEARSRPGLVPKCLNFNARGSNFNGVARGGGAYETCRDRSKDATGCREKTHMSREVGILTLEGRVDFERGRRMEAVLTQPAARCPTLMPVAAGDRTRREVLKF